MKESPKMKDANPNDGGNVIPSIPKVHDDYPETVSSKI